MGTLLDSATIDYLRGAADDSLPSRGTIDKATVVSNAGGGGSVVWTAYGTFDCRVGPLSMRAGQETQEGDRITGETEVVITLPAMTAVRIEDHIRTMGRTYRVSAIEPRSYEVLRRVEAREVD